MTLFQAISRTEELPLPGAQAERYTLDIKQTIAPAADPFELAKDIAALANVTGGVILVGAAEDRHRGTVGRYIPLTDADARRIRDAYSVAARDRCSPVPVINGEILAKDGGFVVAINVWPFPGQAIGVQHTNQPRTYAFPIRVGVDTRWLQAEQLPMLMVPELRRVIIIVDSIPLGGTVRVIGNKRAVDFEVLGSLPLENVFRLRVKARPNIPADRPEFNLPLDMIRSVWRDAEEGWQILVDGQISETGSGGASFSPL